MVNCLWLSHCQIDSQAFGNSSAEFKTVAYDKQRGAHVFGEITAANLPSLCNYQLNWVTLVSWGLQDDYDSPSVAYFRGDSVDAMRRDSAWRSQIALAHAAGYKVFLKPHIWIHKSTEGTWRSDIFPSSEANWELWQKSYREFVLLYARIAEENQVEMYSVGVELTRLSLEKPEFWRTLIRDVREIYSGKITYAANWYQEYEALAFWSDLDYVGIQAYFPLTETENPTVDELTSGWAAHLAKIEAIHERYQKQIVFTEMGYRSTPTGAIKPWEWVQSKDYADQTVSNEIQLNCYQAFFNTVWNEDWLAGVHLWQLRTDFETHTIESVLDFSPQGKPAEAVISRGFSLQGNE